MKKRFFLVSVGTSLIVNYNKNTGSEINIRTLSGITDFPDHNNALKNKMRFINYNNWYDNIKRYIDNGIDNRYQLAKASAEMSSLLFWKDDFRFMSEDRILLVATNTPEGHFCAYALEYLIRKKWDIIGTNGWNKNIVRLKTDIDGLGSAKDHTFGSQGLPHFLEYIQSEISTQDQNKYQVILIPTGGYKALIPYMVIAGILEKVPNRYVYEDSNKVLELPPLPLHVDIPAWLQIESILDVLEGKTDYQNNPVFTVFQDRISGLIVRDDTGRLTRTGLDTIFKQRARQVGDTPELVIRARHSPLLAFMDDNPRLIPVSRLTGSAALLAFMDKNPLTQKFLKLAGIGHLIWKGDRVPEMVDHALRHHNDLFLLAERILLPIFYHKPDFLEPHELYTLLCALFLHDCGHVVGRVSPESGSGNDPRSLLPTEVRDHHHVLGYLRLKVKELEKHGATGNIIYEALKDSGENNDDLWQNYLEAPATIGLYHRKKMQIGLATDTEFEYSFFDRIFYSLQKHMENQTLWVKVVNGNGVNGNKEIDFDKAALLVSLLRIIDGLDEQASRTGGPADVAFHLAQLDTEASEEKARGDALEGALSGIDSIKCAFKKINVALYRRINDYIRAEGKGYTDPEIEAKAEGQTLDAEKFQEVLERTLSHDAIKPMQPLFNTSTAGFGNTSRDSKRSLTARRFS